MYCSTVRLSTPSAVPYQKLLLAPPTGESKHLPLLQANERTASKLEYYQSLGQHKGGAEFDSSILHVVLENFKSQSRLKVFKYIRKAVCKIQCYIPPKMPVSHFSYKGVAFVKRNHFIPYTVTTFFFYCLLQKTWILLKDTIMSISQHLVLCTVTRTFPQSITIIFPKPNPHIVITFNVVTLLSYLQ